MLRKLLGERLMCLIVLGNHQKSARIFIYPVNNPRSDNAVYGGKSVPAVIHDRIHKRPRIISDRRMHNHSLRLIHNQHIIILIYDVKRDVLRFHRELLRFRNDNFNPVAFACFVFFGGHNLSIQKQIPSFYKLLYETPRCFR